MAIILDYNPKIRYDFLDYERFPQKKSHLQVANPDSYRDRVFSVFRGKIQAARYSVGVLPVLRLKKRTKCCG